MRRRGLVVQAPAISHFVAVGLGYVLFFLSAFFPSFSLSLPLSLSSRLLAFFNGGMGIIFYMAYMLRNELAS